MSTTFKHFTHGQIGELTFDQINHAFKLLAWLEANKDRLEALRPPMPGPNKPVEFDAIIVSSQPLPGDQNVWRYAWHEAIRTTNGDSGLWVQDPNGITSHVAGDPYVYPAYNDWEAHNDGAGAEGFGVVVDDTEVNYTVTMLPIPDGVYVRMREHFAQDGSTCYTFYAPNAYEIVCKPAMPGASQ